MLKVKIIDVLYIIIGSLVLAAGINVFMIPNELAAGGVGGLATVLYLTLKIPLSLTVLVLNGFLFIFGAKCLKKWELVKSLLGVVFLSLFLELTTGLPKYTDDLLMAALAGGLLSGVGTAMTVIREASTGGSDMLGLMLARRFHGVSVGLVILVADAAVILISGFAFSSITIMFYAALSVYIGAKVTDGMVVFGDSAKQIQIISVKADIIADRIMNEIGRGATGIYSKGLYSGKDSMTVLCVVNRREARHVINIVKEIDRLAFITIDDVHEVIGAGFKNIGG